MELMAVLLVLLQLLPTAFTANVYYVTADDASHDKQSCPSNQICQNLSYYISQPDSYFTSGTTIIFLEGNHSFDREDLVQVSNVHNLTLKGQGQWPVAGPEETVMQSTVIINCTRGKGGFSFDTSHNITVEGLTVVNCGKPDSSGAVFNFFAVQSLIFHKNSIQHMTGYGLFVHNCRNAIVTNSSYYHSAVCNLTEQYAKTGVGIVYGPEYSIYFMNNILELSYSNITKCCSSMQETAIGGGIYVNAASANIFFSNLVLSYNKAPNGGNLGIDAGFRVVINISNCAFLHGMATQSGGGLYVFPASIKLQIENTIFIENLAPLVSEIYFLASPSTSLSFVNSSIVHTETHCNFGVMIITISNSLYLTNTRMRFANMTNGFHASSNNLVMDSCAIERNFNVPLIVYLKGATTSITNCTFSHNTGGRSVITIQQSTLHYTNSSISNNNMTGITLLETTAWFRGRNVIQNNRNTEGAGITYIPTLSNYIVVIEGELLLLNNTADKHGGAILVLQVLSLASMSNPMQPPPCILNFDEAKNSSLVIFSENRADKGGSDMYGATMMDCYNSYSTHFYEKHVGQRNETSYYFDMDPQLVHYFLFNNTDRLSSMSSDPIMVCFCNNSGLPDCSDRTQHHIQTYPGLEFSTTIVTVGYYGGTSPGAVQVTAQHATLVRSYPGQSENTSCFQLNILLQNTSPTIALVDIRVDHGGLQDWGVSIGVDIIECPIGFIQILGQCHCEQLLDTSNVQCNLSLTPFKFLRSGNSWFAYNNNTQCITGTTNCPFHYCNRSNVSFDIMAPDRQCLGNRAGILCGQCQSHLSIMLGSNRCGTCSNWYIFVLPMFGLAGIVLVAVLMFLNLSVSVGTINGLLFYANLVKLNEAIFFANGSVPVVSQVHFMAEP